MRIGVGFGVGFGGPAYPYYSPRYSYGYPYYPYYPYYYSPTVVYTSPAPVYYYPAAPVETTYVYTTPVPAVAAAPAPAPAPAPVPATEPVVESRPIQPAATVAPAAPAGEAVVTSMPVAPKFAPAPAPAVSGAPVAPPATAPAVRTVVLSGKAAEYARMLLHGSDSARETAADRLKKYNMPGVSTVLVNALQHDGNHDVREEAAISLGCLLARDALPALRAAAREDSASDVRKASLKAVKKIEEACGN